MKIGLGDSVISSYVIETLICKKNDFYRRDNLLSKCHEYFFIFYFMVLCIFYHFATELLRFTLNWPDFFLQNATEKIPLICTHLMHFEKHFYVLTI